MAASAATPWVGLQLVSGTSPAAAVGPMGCCSTNDLAVNGSGAAIAAWVGGERVFTSRRAPSGAWSAPQAVSPAGVTAANGVSAAIDGAGDTIVVWASATGIFSTAAPAGADFAAPRTVKDGLSGISFPSLDVEMNTAGKIVLAFAASSSDPLYATSAPTAAGVWDPPVAISAAGTTAGAPTVAINAAGRAAVAFNEVTTGGGDVKSYYARAALKPADAGFPASSAAVLADADQFSRPVPAIDSAGHVSVLVRTGATPTTQSDRNAVFVVDQAAGTENFSVTGPGNRAVNTCNTGETDTDGRLLVDSSGTVTAVYTCNSAVYAASHAAGGSFNTAPTLVAQSYFAGGIAADTTPDGKQLVVATDTTGTSHAFRRTSPTTAFGSAEAFVDPDAPQAFDDAALDDAGDAIALFTKAGTGGYDQSASLLDVTPGTGTITGPTTATTGDLLTYTFAGTDPFGGFTGLPSWTSSDGGSATAASFVRTFTTAGIYLINVSTKDLGGFALAASKTLVVGTPTPVATATPTASPTVTPTASIGPTPTVSPTASPTPTPVTCVVPKLKGKTVAKARKALKKAHCKLGKVSKPRGHGRKIGKQSKQAKTVLPSGSTVKVTLTRRRR